MIKALVFDCFGVLTAVDSWKLFVGKLPPDQQTIAHDLNIAVDKGQITTAEFSERLTKATGAPTNALDQIFAAEHHKNTALIQYIAELKTTYGLKIGLLSNVASDWITSTLLNAQEASIFDTMVLSYQTGMVKPDPQLFQLTLDRLGVSANETVLADDNRTFCLAAQDLGWRAVHYISLEQFKSELDTILADNAY